MKVRVWFLVKRYTKKNWDLIISLIKSFYKQPLQSLGEMLPIGIICTAAVGFVVALICFIVENGFSRQIDLISENYFSGFINAFTSGTTGLFYSGVIPSIITILLLAELIVLIILFFKNETTEKKIFAGMCMCIDLIFLAGVSAVFVIGYLDRTGILSEATIDKLSKVMQVFMGYQTSSIITGLNITVATVVIAFVVLIILLCKSKAGSMAKDTLKALVVAWVATPLLLWIVENIVPLAGALIVIAIAAVVFCILGLFSSGSAAASSGEGGIQSTHTEERPKTATPKQTKQEVIDDWTGPFWRDKGGAGAFVPQADCIYVNNSWKEKTYVCTVSDYEKGKVAIVDNKTKRRVMDIAGCKRPAY